MIDEDIIVKPELTEEQKIENAEVEEVAEAFFADYVINGYNERQSIDELAMRVHEARCLAVISIHQRVNSGFLRRQAQRFCRTNDRGHHWQLVFAGNILHCQAWDVPRYVTQAAEIIEVDKEIARRVIKNCCPVSQE